MQEIQLLKAIEQDARISVVDLADILNSSPEQVDNEMKKLAEEKVICGYHTVINWDKTNYFFSMTFINPFKFFTTTNWPVNWTSVDS